MLSHKRGQELVGFLNPREGEKRSNLDQLEHREYPLFPYNKTN
jgi:hypothetical protein